MRWPRRQSTRLMALVIVLWLSTPALAASLAQGFKTSSALPPGTLVGLDPSSSDTVRAADTSRLGELVGVVVSNDASVLTVTDTSSNVQVFTSGTANTLVSTINGDIKKGDPITASQISGVGMKATATGRILGLAQADFSSTSVAAVKKSITNSQGQKQTIAVGSIPVLIDVGYYDTNKLSTVVPPFFQRFANVVAGKEVSALRLIIAAGLVLVGLVIVVIIVSAAVRGSMASIGRNPLARRAVSSGLFKVLFLSLVILLVTLGSVYFIIKG